LQQNFETNTFATNNNTIAKPQQICSLWG